VHKIDRLARNLADHVAIRAQLRESHITLASVTESLEDSVSGQLVEHILASMAEFYSTNLSEEVKKGMRQKVLRGGWPHQPPRGYRIVRASERSSIVIDDVEGPLIRKAFELCLTGYRGIVDLSLRVAAAGLRTRNTNRPLSNGSLGTLLRNPFYCGMMRWNGDVYPASHPPLISHGLFEQVQRVLASPNQGPDSGTQQVPSDRPGVMCRVWSVGRWRRWREMAVLPLSRFLQIV
jgi:DNA invertase Pin-like site-specific DNA recombinase